MPNTNYLNLALIFLSSANMVILVSRLMEMDPSLLFNGLIFLLLVAPALHFFIKLVLISNRGFQQPNDVENLIAIGFGTFVAFSFIFIALLALSMGHGVLGSDAL
ncbi:hypothetical protein GGR57DRAFT_468416 [Xylariaceae sp. FL1272]|nr:hypothetical protein GGR57DRAFT_468416 [Xylariaceae sp. FL1272]